MNFNRVILGGNLTRDVEVKPVGQNQTPKASFAIAVNSTYKDQTKAHFFECEAWGRLAEILGQYFHKGSRILIEGRLEYDQWTGQQGEKRSRVKVIAETFQFVDRKSDDVPSSMVSQDDHL